MCASIASFGLRSMIFNLFSNCYFVTLFLYAVILNESKYNVIKIQNDYVLFILQNFFNILCKREIYFEVETTYLTLNQCNNLTQMQYMSLHDDVLFVI